MAYKSRIPPMKDLSKRRRVESGEVLGDRRYISLCFLRDGLECLLEENELKPGDIPTYLKQLSKKQKEEALEWVGD